MPINIYIITGQPVLRQVLCGFLDKRHDLKVCGTARTPQEALAQLGKLAADVVLIDVALPGRNGMEVARELRSRHPHVCCLLLADAQAALDVRQAMAAGARGCIDQAVPQEVEWAIWQALNGAVYISRPLRQGWVDCGEYEG